MGKGVQGRWVKDAGEGDEGCTVTTAYTIKHTDTEYFGGSFNSISYTVFHIQPNKFFKISECASRRSRGSEVKK